MTPGRHVIDTASGRRLNLDDPKPDQIAIEDIAGALSRICRFGAQSTRFHSVAQHAVLVFQLVDEHLGRPDLALWALHHDSHEAYTCDIPRPLKLKLRDSGNTVYDDICARLDVAIGRALAITPTKGSTDAAVIDRADDMALLIEAKALLVRGASTVLPKRPFTHADRAVLPTLGLSLPSDQAEAAFLVAHRRAIDLAA